MNEEELTIEAEELVQYLIREYFDEKRDKRNQLIAIKAMELMHFNDKAEEMKTDYEFEHG